MGENSIDWGSEWVTSAVWIVGVFLAALVGSVLVGLLLLRTTVWGRQFRRLVGRYFRPGRELRSWGPLLLALSLLLMCNILEPHRPIVGRRVSTRSASSGSRRRRGTTFTRCGIG